MFYKQGINKEGRVGIGHQRGDWQAAAPRSFGQKIWFWFTGALWFLVCAHTLHAYPEIAAYLEELES
jgi:hypothetical protein